jgi:hypothetical protein
VTSARAVTLFRAKRKATSVRGSLAYHLARTTSSADQPRDVVNVDRATPMTARYDVVLSFAGEDREYVDKVASGLKELGVRVFYDRYEEASVWGKDLVEHFDSVYRSDGRYCVMFISKAYAAKMWTRHERRSALARGLESKREYVLPARFDDAEIDGLRPTTAYADLRRLSPSDLVGLIAAKLERRLS